MALFALIKKELIQALRDKRMRFILIVAPVLQIILFGYAATTDIKNIPMLIIDYNRSSRSRELTSSFFASGYFSKVSSQTITIIPADFLKSGRAKVVVIIAPDFSKNIGRQIPAQLQMLIDGSDANSASITKSYLEEIIRAFSMKLLNGRQPNIISGIGITPEIRIWYNPELKSAYYMVPGILCMILLIITALLTAIAITKERELGTLEQILVSPLKRWEFILGKTIPFMLVGFMEMILVLVVAKMLFNIPIQGSLVLLFFCATLFLFTTLGLGLFAASVAKTQIQAMLTIFPVIMPTFLLSGLFFPISSIPVALRWIAYVNPLTHFLIIVRGILLKGVGIFEIYKEIIILAVFGVLFISFSVFRFHKRIE